MSRRVTAAQALMFAVSMAALSKVRRSGERVTVAAVAAEMRKLAHVEPAHLVEEAADAAIYATACARAKAAGLSDAEVSAAGDAACVAAGGRPGPGPVTGATKRRVDAAADAANAAEIERQLDAGGVADAADAIAAAIRGGAKPEGRA